MRGWVYIISNQAMPDIYKIGFTTKPPEIRASELSNFATPLPYKVEYEILVDNPKDLESKIHRKLFNFNIKPDKKQGEGIEWFEIKLLWAVRAIEEIAFNSQAVYYQKYNFIVNKITTVEGIMDFIRFSNLATNRVVEYERKIRNLPLIEEIFRG